MQILKYLISICSKMETSSEYSFSAKYLKFVRGLVCNKKNKKIRNFMSTNPLPEHPLKISLDSTGGPILKLFIVIPSGIQKQCHFFCCLLVNAIFEVCVFIPSAQRVSSPFLRNTGPLIRESNFFSELSTSGRVVRTQT